MSESLFFVHDDSAAAQELAQPYVDRGWTVEVSSSDAEDAVDRIFDCGSLALVFFMDGTPVGACRALALEVFDDERTDHPLMVFVNGEREVVEAMKPWMPHALFVQGEELPWLLKHLSFKG